MRTLTSTRDLGALLRRLAPALALLALLVVGAGRAAAQSAEDDLREGDRYFEEGEWRRAANSYDAAIRKYPGQVPPEAYGKRAAIFIILKDLKGGLAFIRDIAKRQYPDAPEILEQEALILWELGQKADAISVAEKVVGAKPTAWSNQRLIGEFYSTQATLAAANRTATAYEAYIVNRPPEQERADVMPRIRLGFAYLTLAQDAYRAGKSDQGKTYNAKAVEQFETLERRYGKQPHAMVNAENGLCAAYTSQRAFDRAITVCERIIQDPRRIDSNGSVWYNLGKAYLKKKQPRRARTAANEYVRLRKTNARGFILIGDTYFEEKDWNNALDYYLRAEKLLKPNQSAAQVELSIALGKTYLRLPQTGSAGTNANLALAINKLEAGFQANPNEPELAAELGSAYLKARQDGKAYNTADKLINAKEFPQHPVEFRKDLYLVAGKALYNQGKLKDSRSRFEQALALSNTDLTVRRLLIEAINQQAWQEVSNKSPKQAETLLLQAQEVDSKSAMTSLNLAVLAMDQDDCDGAVKYLEKLKKRGGYTLVYERLTARSFLCRARPDPKAAAEHYAAADREVKKVQANLIQAEIYTEWAPLTMNSDVDDSVDKLQTAVQFAAQQPYVAQAAKRNLAVALFKRGWKLMRENKAGEAANDFERAGREPALLRGTEPLAFEFSLALAMLDKGDYGNAARTFKALSGKGNANAYLKPPYNKIGGQLFSAYASYRSPNTNAKEQAAGDFANLQKDASGNFSAKIRDLVASAWESVAYDQWKQGKGSQAQKSLANAGKYAVGDIQRRVAHNRAVLSMSRSDVATFEQLRDQPPEALVNLGILYDQQGRARDAYDAWTRARKANADSRDLQKWIDAKKRIYGF